MPTKRVTSVDGAETDPVSTGPVDRTKRLTSAWQMMVGITWSVVFFAYAATWKASEEIGIGTWWLGPRAAPQPTLVKIVPFTLAVAVALAAAYNVRRLAWVSIGGALLAALIAVGDMSRSGGLAAIEFAIAGAALLVSIASLTGQYRARSDGAAPAIHDGSA